MTSPAPERRKAESRSATTRNASRRRSTRSVRHSLESSTAARSRFPRYSSIFASNFANSARASAVEPAKPASTWPLWRRRILRAPCFITVWPSVTWPSPAMAERPRWRTARIVVPWRVGGAIRKPRARRQDARGFLSIVSVLRVLDARSELLGGETTGPALVEVALVHLDHQRLLRAPAEERRPGDEVHRDRDVFLGPEARQRGALPLELGGDRGLNVPDDRVGRAAIGGLLEAEPHLPGRGPGRERSQIGRGRRVGLDGRVGVDRGCGRPRSGRGRGGRRGRARQRQLHHLPLGLLPRALDVAAHGLHPRLQLVELGLHSAGHLPLLL